MWNDSFRIGNGKEVAEESAPAVYRNYKEDCDIDMTPELFEQISRKLKIYFQTETLKNIVFKPKDVMEQTTSNYYFCHLDVKFPR